MSYANILEKTIFSLVTLVTIGAFLWPFYHAEKEDEEWQKFKEAHSCKVVERNLSTTGYLCDDGVLYRR